jgi:hypothetical protein
MQIRTAAESDFGAMWDILQAVIATRSEIATNR